MNKITNIYINNKMVLNFNNMGQLASLKDLEEEVCSSGTIFTQLLQTTDGMVKWQSAEDQRKILGMDADTTQEELNECTGEYILVNKDVPKLYAEFINDLDLDLQEVISVNFCAEEPLMLIGITHMYNSQFVHILNFWEEYGTKKMMTSNVIVPKFMLAV